MDDWRAKWAGRTEGGFRVVEAKPNGDRWVSVLDVGPDGYRVTSHEPDGKSTAGFSQFDLVPLPPPAPTYRPWATVEEVPVGNVVRGRGCRSVILAARLCPNGNGLECWVNIGWDVGIPAATMAKDFVMDATGEPAGCRETEAKP